ncbi:hypothetical protein [Nereida sp. MMG025]|uniref:hypothetical protein n=1 Tax=Nereida sp. MMG025 TaxID=2909981 RepID=UPI001F3196D0|nr:hypothetical protein [Nereida sp. MMG025]MCF6445725.1 hypothetical protein [Nereida sp. MMG025]
MADVAGAIIPDDRRSNGVIFKRYYSFAIAAMAPLCVLHFVFPTGAGNAVFDSFLNSFGQMYMAAIFLILAAKIVLKEADTIWTPLFWLPLQCGIFFGFGPLVEVFGDELTRLYLSRHFLSVTDTQLAQANGLSVVGTTAILLGVYAHLRYADQKWVEAIERPVAQSANLQGLKVTALFFVLFGLYLKYGVVVPAQHEGRVVPGVITKMTPMVDAGYAMLAYLVVARRDSLLAIVFALTFPVHLTLSVLSFSKSAVVVALLLPVLGAHLARPRLRRLALSFLIILIVYSTLQPLVVHGRNSIYMKAGNISRATHLERFDIATDFFLNPSSAVGLPSLETQRWWTRFSFVGQQAIAIELHEQGQKSESLNNVWMYFVPRVLWPNKPVLYAPGLEFYQMVTQSDRRSLMPATVFGDLYWQFGWTGVLVGSFLVGWLFSLLSILCFRIVRNRDLAMLPVLAIIVEMSANSLSKFVINGIISPLPLIVAYFLLFTFISKMSLRR